MSWRTVPLPAEWPQIRRDILARDSNVCRYGMLPDEYIDMPCAELATQVDHMGDPNDHRPELLRAICVTHHNKRTASQGVAGRARIRQARRRKPERHPGFKREDE